MHSDVLAGVGQEATTTQCVSRAAKGTTDLPVNIPSGCFGPMTFAAPPPTWTFRKTCPSDTTETVVIEGAATGDFSRGYGITMTITTSGAADPARNGQVRQSLQARWLTAVCR